MKPHAAVNDWVYSSSPGIWRIYRVIQNMQKLRFSLQERQKIDRRWLIFSKRLVDESWEPAFSNEVAGADIVYPVSGQDRQQLNEWIAKNPQAMNQFEAFQPAPIDLMVNLPLNVPISVGKDHVQRLVQEVFSDIGATGLTNEAILQRIATSELTRYAPMTMSNATLQFVCNDYELRGNEHVLRKARLLMV